jgi:hypothetical protein
MNEIETMRELSLAELDEVSGGNNAAIVNNNPRAGGLDENGASGHGLILTQIFNNSSQEFAKLVSQGHHLLYINATTGP